MIWAIARAAHPPLQRTGKYLFPDVDYPDHRLVMTDLEDDVLDHVDYPDHRLVTIHLGEDV